MAEPLKKEDLICMGAHNQYQGCSKDCVKVSSIKSAFEWIDENYDKLQKEWIKEPNNEENRYFSKWVRKRAFPAIYEPTDKEGEVEKEKGDDKNGK